MLCAIKTRNIIRIQNWCAFRALSTVKNATQVDCNVYIPGKQGLAPGFGPPPVKPKSAKKIKKLEVLANIKRKKQLKSNQVNKAVPNSKMEQKEESRLSPPEDVLGSKSEAAQDTQPKKGQAIPENLVQSIATVKQTIDVEGLSYNNKVHLIRRQYEAELVLLKKKQQQKLLEDAKAIEMKSVSEAIEREKRTQELEAARQMDHLSSLNLPQNAEVEQDVVNPFHDPVAKAERVAIKAQHHAGVMASKKQHIKETLLTLFYSANEYVTPENIDEKLKDFILKGSTLKDAKSSLFDTKVNTNSSGPDESGISRAKLGLSREARLFDILQGTLDGKPGVEKIEQNRSSGELASDLASVMESNKDNNS